MSDDQPGWLRLRPSVEWREVEGEIVALDLDRSVYLAANESGALMWRLLSQGVTHASLVDSLAQTYGLERSVAERDVAAFVEELDRQNCLERSEVPR